MRNITRALTLSFSAALLLAGCSGDGNGDANGNGDNEPVAEEAGELTVWLLEGSQTKTVIDAAIARFNESYPNVAVTVELQQPVSNDRTLAGALRTDDPPDVFEIAKPSTASFAARGLLADLSDAESDLGLGDMIEGMTLSGELDGVRYAVPYWGGTSVVVYNTEQFGQAGITETPTSLDALAEAAAQLAEANSSVRGYSALYFPATNWSGALPFIWEAGGEIAEQDGGTWTGRLDSVESRAGLQRLKDLVAAYSTAPADADARSAIEAFSAGRVGMLIDSWFVPGVLSGPTGGMAGKVGAFPLPGTADGSPAPSYVEGSDLAVAEESPDRASAIEWIKTLTGVEIQAQLAQEAGVVPVRESAFAGHSEQPFLQAADQAALNSRFTPVSPRWPLAERARILPEMLERILERDAPIENATVRANRELDAVLNGG